MMKVKLVALKISKLHGCYNYDVEFNSDVTFIYGENGCGKTTILNITEIIITGQLYKLFNYAFTEIELTYDSKNGQKKPESIRIENRKKVLAVIFNGHNFSVTRDRIYDEMMMDDADPQELQWRYFEINPFLKEIRRTFNYVYLPLNRSMKSSDLEMNSKKMFYMQRIRDHAYYEAEIDDDSQVQDLAMIQVQQLISRKHTEMMAHISNINDGFRNEILKSLLEANKKSSFSDVFQGIIGNATNNTIQDLQNTKISYIKTLNDLNIVSKQEEASYIRFFDDFIEDFSNYLQETSTNSVRGISVELLMKYQEVTKMKEIVSIAERIEKKKSKVREPMDIFIKTMNDFIGTTREEKEIIINQNGRISFRTRYNNKPIDIQNLSSGEKQLLTFFANLIFNVKSQRAGIFVVDEPELSLHLSWQKMFVEKTMGINKNIQLIFATHAPEIIGARRNKMFKLEKQYALLGSEK